MRFSGSIRPRACIPLLLGLAGVPVFSQPGGDFFRLGQSPFQLYAPPRAKPHPFDRTQPLEARVRSYLDANCAHCHQPGVIERGGLDLRFITPLERTALLGPGGRRGPDRRDIPHVQPGNAHASEIYLRLASVGSDAMPPLGRMRVDEPGLALIREWIESLSSDSASPPLSSPGKSFLSIQDYGRRTLEIGGIGLKTEGVPVFRIRDATGARVLEVTASVIDHPIRHGWILRFSRTLPRGRYWVEIKTDGVTTVRDFLVI